MAKRLAGTPNSCSNACRSSVFSLTIRYGGTGRERGLATLRSCEQVAFGDSRRRGARGHRLDGRADAGQQLDRMLQDSLADLGDAVDVGAADRASVSAMASRSSRGHALAPYPNSDVGTLLASAGRGRRASRCRCSREQDRTAPGPPE